MIKQLAVTINLIVFFILGWFFSGTVDITQNVPQQAKVNEEFTVEVTINKSDLEGFAKYQAILPQGFTAKPGETKGATYSFKDQKVKFIWMALPADEEITISYKVTASEKGEYTIGGKFAYIYNNERGEKDAPSQTVKIVGDSEELLTENTEQPTENSDTTQPEQPESQEETTASSENETPTENTTQDIPVADETTQPEEINTADNNENNNTFNIRNISISQSIDKNDDNTYTVSVTINKGDLTGFAKFEANIPNGFKAQSYETQGSNFAFRNQKAKFLWMALPSESNFTIKYNLIPVGASSGNYSIDGTFSYVENDETRTKSIETQSFTFEGGESFANNTESSTTLPEENTNTLPSEPENNQEDAQVSDNESTETQRNEPVQTNNTPAPAQNPAAANVKYKVQIAAGHSVTPMNYFKKKYKLSTHLVPI